MPRLRAIALALLCVYPVKAAELPDLGEAARVSFSTAQEERLGQEIMRQIRASRQYLDDAEITDYLNGLGERLVAASDDPGRHFEFFVVRDPSLNAFALPGGYIGVHTGLIAAARNEAELAGVLAHEIAHVTQNHLARLVKGQENTALAALAGLAVAILAARSNQGQLAEAAIAATQALSLQSQLDYTREHEREADRVGFQILERAGFSPFGMASFFERLQAQGRLYENNAPDYLRTHPLTHERIADMQNRLQDKPYRLTLDSLEFRLVRAKVQALQGDASEAVKRFAAQAHEDETEAVVRRYGLTLALLRLGERERAQAEIRRIPAAYLRQPMFATLAAEVAWAQGRDEEAQSLLQASLQRQPNARPLAYAYAQALLRRQEAAAALAFLREQQRTYPDDARLYELRAKAHQRLGEVMDSHLALAEAHVLRRQYEAAVEQLQLALRSGERDFYKLSTAEARLRQVRELERQQAGR